MEGDYVGDMMPLIGLLRQHAAVFDDHDHDTSSLTWMKRSADTPPSSALNHTDVQGINSQNGLQQQHDEQRPQYSNNAAESNTPLRFQRQQKQELLYPPQSMNQAYPTPTATVQQPSFDNINNSFDWSANIKNEHNPAQYKLPSRPACPPSGGSDWSARESSASNSQPGYGMMQQPQSTKNIKNEHNPAQYKLPSRPACPPSGGSDWSARESSASNSQPGYGMMQQPQSTNSIGHGFSPYFDNNGYQHNNMYNNSYGQVGYSQPNYSQHPQPYQQPPRMADRFNQHMPVPVARRPMPDFQRRYNQNTVQGPPPPNAEMMPTTQVPNAEMMPTTQIKREPEEYSGANVPENFTSLFTQSIMSLQENDPGNEFPEENNLVELTVLSASHPVAPPAMDSPVSFQRLHTSGGHFTSPSGEYQGDRNNFGFFDSRMSNCISPSSDIQEIGSKGMKVNSFRYDRPSFDDVSMYASNSTVSKPSTSHKRKNNLPSVSNENHTSENRKISPLATQWIPSNSKEFDVISIKQEPLEDYTSNELDALLSSKDSPASSSNSTRVKTPEQQKEHLPKQPARKRSPGSTCFDRFEKKSTPAAKKVSPLSVYAKVQDNIVLNVKCRRYKKRTKPITIKEEPVSPNREEMENFKRSSLTPDQAAQSVMSELVERVSLFGERNVVGDLSHMDPRQLRDRLLQFCQRANLDYRDFDDPSCILRPRIVMDTKNSVRASAIRKRTSTSPVEVQPPPVQEKVVKTRKRGRKKADLKESLPVEKRVLRQLPGRTRGRPRSQSPVDTKQNSTGKSREGEEEKKAAEVIDLLNDSEDEASKMAEVQKKSQRGKRKRVPAEKLTAVSSGSLEDEMPSKAVSIDKITKKTKKETVEKGQIKEKGMERAKPVARRRKREISLEDLTNLENEVPEEENELRRRTRSRGKRVVIPEDIPQLPPRKRRACAQRRTNYNFESEVEIVDIVPRRRLSRSPPMLKAIKLEPLSPKPVSKTKPKRTRKKRSTKSKKVKKDTPKPIEICKFDADIEIEPPILQNSVAETETRNALKREPPLLESEEEPMKRKKSKKAKLPSFEAPEIKTEEETKVKPFLTVQVQNAVKESTGSVAESLFVSKSPKDDKNTILSTNNKFLKNNEPPSLNSVVKSGSSKRKQEGPSKYLKDNSKKASSQTFLKLNSNDKNLKPDVMNGLSYSTSNLVLNLNSAHFMKVDTPSAIVPPSDNSKESLKERYRKSFCVESLPLPKTSWRQPKENVESSSKTNLLQKSNNSAKTPKGSLDTSSHHSNSSKKNDEFSSKLKIKSSDKTFFNLIKNMKAPCDISSTFITKVKEEPLSDDDIPYNFSHVATPSNFSTTKFNSDNKTEKNPAKLATTSKAKSDTKAGRKLPKPSTTVKDYKDTKSGKKPSKQATSSKDISDFKTEKKPPHRRLSTKSSHRMHSSQSSECEPQVVLTVLPDAQVDLRNGSVADELVRKCEKEQERMEAVIKEEVQSEYDSDEDKPLACFQTKRTQYLGSNNSLRPDSSPPDKKGASRTWKDNDLKKSVNLRRYSDSEDSDCGLVIDLDRRLSVEEQVPSPTHTDNKFETASQHSPSSRPVISIKVEEDSNSASVEEEPAPSIPYHDATEEAHILLELSRSGMQSFKEETVAPSTGTVTSSEASEEGRDADDSEEKGSILRTLLLENGDADPGQDLISNPGLSTSTEHQSTLNQEADWDLLRQANVLPFLTSKDGKNIFDPSQFPPNQFSPNANNPDFKNCDLEEEIMAAIRKVKKEIKNLSKKQDGINTEGTSFVCVIKYKEEVLKNLLLLLAKLKTMKNDSLKNIKKEKESEGISSASRNAGEYSELREGLKSHLTVRTGMPSVTVTSGDCLASNSGENLPPVETMVASANDNYGVDLRTVTTKQEDVCSNSTILQEALSSKEKVYRPVAIRSPLMRPQRSDDSSLILQKKSLATQDCSFIPNLPSISEFPPRSQSSFRQYSRRHSKRSPSSSNPGFNPSFTPVTQPHARTSSDTTPSHHEPFAMSHNGIIPSTSSISSPSSCSAPTYHQRIILRTEPGSPLNISSIDLSTNQMFSNRFTSYARTNDHSSNRSTITRENDFSSNRSATMVPMTDHSSNRSSSLDLTSGLSFTRTFSNRLNSDLSSNRSTYIGSNKGHSSSRSARQSNSDSTNRSNSTRPTSGHSSHRSSTIGLDHSSNRLNTIQETNFHSSNRSPSIESTNSHSFNRSGSITHIDGNPSNRSSFGLANGYSSNGSAFIDFANSSSSNRSSSIERANGYSSNGLASIDLTHSNLSSRSSSIGLINGYSSDRSASIEPINGYSSNGLASMDLDNGHSSSESNSFGLANGHSSSSFGLTTNHSPFMIVPPPTTLESSFGQRGLHSSMPEAQSEIAMDIKVEDTHELENEGPRSYLSCASSTSFLPYAGLLTSIAPSLDHCPRCKGCGKARPNFVCSGCKSHWYCSTECQNLRWSEHSRTCLRDQFKENSTNYK